MYISFMGKILDKILGALHRENSRVKGTKTARDF